MNESQDKKKKRIYELRSQCELTQKALAEKVGVPYRWIQKLESGEILTENITLKKAIALADALGVDVKELI